MNKCVLITGASSELGKELAKLYAKNNYNLILTYLRGKDKVIRLTRELMENYKIDVTIYKVDLSSESNIDEFCQEIGEFDILINNAAYNNDTEWDKKDTSEFKKILDVNLIAPYLLTRNLKSKIKEGGSIINIASTNGIDTMYPESLDYDASKAGLINLTKNLAQVLSPKIRVNAICPGWINTKSTSDMNPTFKKKEEEKILLNRFANAKEIAEFVYFVTSDKGTYLNGAILKIDGGIK